MKNKLIDHPDIESILINQEQIAEKVTELGEQITNDYQGLKPIVIPILKGAAIFSTDLLRAMSIDVDLDYIDVSSYNGTTSTHDIKINRDIDIDVTNRDVILIDEIIDTGFTLEWASKFLLGKGAKSVKTAVFVDKSEKRENNFSPDYVGFQVPDKFIVGYGMDFNQRFRHLPVIAIIKTNK